MRLDRHDRRPGAVVDLAVEAKAAGWDGVFYFDAIAIGAMELYDPWVLLAAVAQRTERVRIGAILTPPSRRRPWKLAREAMTLDRLSGGRLVLPVGLGTLDDAGFANVGEPTDARTRAGLLDESLDILGGLWSGQPFVYQDQHYHFEEMTFRPTPVQEPRIPIWVAGAWPDEDGTAVDVTAVHPTRTPYGRAALLSLGPDAAVPSVERLDEARARRRRHRLRSSSRHVWVLQGSKPVIPIDLSGQTALVTGAGQGLGATTARMLHEAGANVVVNYLADPAGENLERARETTAGWGERGTVIEADVRAPEAVASMVEQTVARFGSLDIVVNNAGILRDRTARNMAPEEWQAVIDANLTGVFNVCHAAIGPLSDGGRIVNISSVSAFLGIYGQINYAAAKAGVVGLTKVLARELARRRITVNAVAPGAVEAGMGLTIPEDFRNEMLRSIPLGRFADPHEIAGVILFLCSDLGSYITGQTVHVNGGWWGP